MKKVFCTIAIVLSATICLGAPITIVNPSFETPDSSGGTWPMSAYGINGNGWTVVAGSQGGWSRAINIAAVQSPGLWIGQTIPAGQGAQIGLNQFDHTLYQDLAALYGAGKQYTLTAKFGFSNQSPVGKMYLSLETPGGTVLGVSEYDPPAAYTQIDATVNINMADHVAEIGETIRVKIRTDQTSGQSNFGFDLVQLEEIPEPAMGIFALLGILAVRKFRG